MTQVVSKDNNPATTTENQRKIELYRPSDFIGVDDGGESNRIRNQSATGSIGDFDSVKKNIGLRDPSDIDYYNQLYRFGVFNPYDAVSTTREFLFFTKPDLYIYDLDETNTFATSNLRPELQSIPFWNELASRYPRVIQNLQSSCRTISPFNLLLGNMVNSNLDIPGLSAETIDTPSNMYGVGFSYRGSSEASNDSFEFSLEFKDTKYLPIYTYFKAYEEYETLKHHGTIGPYKKYIENKIIHDQFAIYKFLVQEDMETILYYAKFYGVMMKDLPRDVFSSSTFDSGLSFSIGFKAAFFDDMDPLILADFNTLTESSYQQAPYRIGIYNKIMGRMDNRAVTTARVIAEENSNYPGGYKYKLKWRGYET